MKLINNTIYLIITLFISLAVTSCDNDDKPKPSNNSLLTSGQWQGVTIYIDGKDATQEMLETDGFDFKKQIYKYEKDGKYVGTYGQEATTGTWEFTENEKAILHDKSEQKELKATIKQLTDKSLHLEFIYNNKTFEERYSR